MCVWVSFIDNVCVCVCRRRIRAGEGEGSGECEGVCEWCVSVMCEGAGERFSVRCWCITRQQCVYVSGCAWCGKEEVTGVCGIVCVCVCVCERKRRRDRTSLLGLGC
jgi:hypothetical protein